MRQCRVLQARRAGSILTYVTREASAARREIGRETPPSVVFCEMSVYIVEKIPCNADNSFEFIPCPCYIYPEQMLKIQENITNERYRMDKMLQQY